VAIAGTSPFERVLAAGGRRIRTLMEEVEQQLTEITSAYGAELERSAGSTLAAGGKRLRPLLVFISGSEAGEGRLERDSLVRAGAAVELAHMASLVHDDVLDSASLRRGRPTIYADFGPSTATATGDFLFSRAFRLLRGGTRLEQVRTLSDACLALARGELAQRHDAYARFVGVDRYLQRCELKTASLFEAACKLGSLACGHDGPRTGALGRFGHRVGVAFQLLDDVLDVEGTAEQTGKQRGSDLLDGTVTLPLILASEADPELGTLDLRLVDSREEAERICERIAATDALAETRRRATELVAEAVSEIDGRLDPAVAELLRLVADGIVERYS
jgi:geranylgeranyl pyrophosphate synthase